jgi:hypothetical protein
MSEIEQSRLKCTPSLAGSGFEIDGGSETCGYIANTTAPKHLGAVFFASFFQAGIRRLGLGVAPQSH